MVEDYSELQLERVIQIVTPLDEEAMAQARARQESLAKPPHSLGRLEDLSVQLAGITGKVCSLCDRRRIIILSADNGVVEEGVSCTPQSVTLAQTINFTRGLTGVATLARHYDTDLQVVDIGINAEFSHPGVLDRKIALGTKNIAKESAMTRQQCVNAIMTGITLALQASDEGYEILGVGEMGIGNTTTTAAVLSALTGLSVEDTVGKGGGLLEKDFIHKKEVVAGALERLKPDRNDPVDVIAKVGGFDIAAMAGVFIGAAACRLPVVIDGYISIVAALAAARLCPNAKGYMIPSHASYEKGYLRAANELGLRALLDMDMRLGEGSGCPLAFGIISAACAIMCEMGTFDAAEIDDKYLEEIRKGDSFSA